MTDSRIYRSMWHTIDEKWEALTPHQWKDFALIALESEHAFTAKSVLGELAQISMDHVTEMSSRVVVGELVHRALVLENHTDMSIAVFVSTINFYKMLLDYLPWYDQINPTMQAICRAFDVIYRYLEQYLSQVERNLDIDTAIEMLEHYESVLGIKTDKDLSYKQRRGQVKAVMQSMHQQVTEGNIAKLSAAFSNNHSKAEVLRTDKRDVFDIRFVANGLPNNMDGLEAMLKKSMPAHLAWEISYTQNPWSEIVKKRYRWRDVTSYTWKSINEYKTV